MKQFFHYENKNRIVFIIKSQIIIADYSHFFRNFASKLIYYNKNV